MALADTGASSSVAEDELDTSSLAEAVDASSVAEDELDASSLAEQKLEMSSVAEEDLDTSSLAEQKLETSSVAEEDLDVLVVGAGLSGIAAAYRLQTECPGKSFAVLDGRPRVGGTWDLFRYPGVRSDSDMFTLGFAFRPWKEAKSIADGPSILSYIRGTAAEFGIDRAIRLNHRVVAASWSSAEARWRVDVEVPVAPDDPAAGVTRAVYRARFVHLCTGYYSYDRPYQPEFPGRERFEGDFVHPQFWPEDLSYEGKRVVVIGSGATAVTVVPAMAKTAAHVTMLQRSPSYMISLPAKDRFAGPLRRLLPDRASHAVLRWKNVLLGQALYQLCRRRPERAKALLLQGVRRTLPGYEIDPDFVPRYAPWDQRLCIVPNGDLFRAIRRGRASIVTDRIATLTERGVELESGRELEADLIVSATGLSMIACGDIALDVDGTPVETGKTLIYRGFMLSNVPNLTLAVGYTNASFTLRSDLCSRAACRLLNHMERHGYEKAVPIPHNTAAVPLAAFDLSSGYIARALEHLPKQGSRRPWKVRQNYVLDLLAMKFGNVRTSMKFEPARQNVRLPRPVAFLARR